MNINIESLIIELGRGCNMSCADCLRGEKETGKLYPGLIPKIFDGISEVDSIVYSGGEPALYSDVALSASGYAKRKDDLIINGCYVATNGFIKSPDLVESVRILEEKHLKDILHSKYVAAPIHPDEKAANAGRCMFCFDEDYPFAIALSLDEYHDPIPLENALFWKRCGYFVKDKIHTKPWEPRGIGRGKALKNSFPVSPNPDNFYFSYDGTSDTLTVETAYVSYDGYVYADCDLSYEICDEFAYDSNFIGKRGLGETLRSLYEEEENDD